MNTRTEDKGTGRVATPCRLKCPIFRRFSGKILFLGVVAGIIPLVFLLFFTVFSQVLTRDVHHSLSELKAREGQRLESYQHKLIHQQVRQKALDVAQDVVEYLKNHQKKTWEQILQDPDFREVAVQPVGMVGETFLVAAPDKTILLHRKHSCEGQPLARVVCLEGDRDEPPNLQLYGSSSLQEFSLKPDQGGDSFFHGFLVPVAVQPLRGPKLMVGAWVDQGEMDLLLGQSRTIFKTTLNVSETLIGNRLVQFRERLFYVLAILGSLAFIGSMFLARSLTRQVNRLASAAEAFDQGNLGYRIAEPGQDELGQLARTLNRMAASLNDNTISRMEWENTFNALPDQVIVVDAEACVTRLNRAAALYLEVFPEEALRSHLTELKQPGKDWFPEEALAQALEQGKKTQTERCTDDQHTFLVTVDPCRDLKGSINGAVFVARDISALKRMQSELAKASHFLQQIIDSAPLGFMFINPQGLITEANAQVCREFGFVPEDLLNRPYARLYANEAEYQQVISELAAKGEALAHQVEIQGGDGLTAPARLSVRTLPDKDGEVIGTVCLMSNITEEVSLQRQLEQAQKQEVIATLAGGLAHNFNNLLMIIMGLTTLVLEKISPDHPIYEDLKDIERQLRAGREVTRKLLAFRRASSYQIQPISLNNLVEATADMFGRTRQELVIHKELSPDLPAVEVDSSQIQQVLINLLINAWHAMPQGGEILLRTRAVHLTDWDDPTWELEPGPHVCLSVTDTGIGMDENTVSHLFSPFFTTKEPGLGSGLGLASAYRIMKNHRGAIQVISTPGEGSTFTLFFPSSAAVPLDVAPEEKQIVPGQGTILVVEDEPTLRRVSSKLLEKLGYQVLEASCGERALEIFSERNGEIDLVLLDMIMPGLTGLQTLERLRALNPRVRVILCSGMDEAKEENLPSGVSFVPKPVPLEILSQKVAAALGS
jgi:two-component system, cell cycle sensor histidine kinase and response regulator CckA